MPALLGRNRDMGGGCGRNRDMGGSRGRNRDMGGSRGRNRDARAIHVERRNSILSLRLMLVSRSQTLTFFYTLKEK